MSNQNTQTDTPVLEPAPNSDSKKTDGDWEKRYKDLQTDLTKRANHEKELEKSMQDLQGNYEQLTQYVAQNTPPADDQTGLDFVSKNDINQMQQRISKQIEATNLASEFRSKYPDMVKHEDLVAFYLESKTDKRNSLRDRMDSAVKSAKEMLSAERKQGVDDAKKVADDKAAEEAKAAGLSYETTPPDSGLPKAETGQEYLAWRKQRSAKKRGYVE